MFGQNKTCFSEKSEILHVPNLIIKVHKVNLTLCLNVAVKLK